MFIWHISDRLLVKSNDKYDKWPVSDGGLYREVC